MLMDIAAAMDAEPDHSQSGSDENYQRFPTVWSMFDERVMTVNQKPTFSDDPRQWSLCWDVFGWVGFHRLDCSQPVSSANWTFYRSGNVLVRQYLLRGDRGIRCSPRPPKTWPVERTRREGVSRYPVCLSTPSEGRDLATTKKNEMRLTNVQIGWSKPNEVGDCVL